MSTHGGYSFPGPNTLFGRVHRVSRSPFLRYDGSSLRSFIPVPRPLVPVIRPLLTDSSHQLLREKRYIGMYTALDCYTFGIVLRYNCDFFRLIGIKVGVTLLAYSSGRTKEFGGENAV